MLILRRLLFLRLDCRAGRRAVLPEALLKQLRQFGVSLLPLVEAVDLQGAEVVARPLLDGERRQIGAGRMRGQVAFSTRSLQFKLEHDLLLDALFVVEVEDRTHAGTVRVLISAGSSGEGIVVHRGAFVTAIISSGEHLKLCEILI